jgi:hypothetical protein
MRVIVKLLLVMFVLGLVMATAAVFNGTKHSRAF